MPIDLGRVVDEHNADDGDLVYPTTARLIEEALTQKQNWIHTMKERNAFVSKLRRQKRRNGASVAAGGDATEDRTTTTNNEKQQKTAAALEELEEQFERECAQLRSILWKIPNWIDRHVLRGVPESYLGRDDEESSGEINNEPPPSLTAPQQQQQANPSVVEDPIFCLGGYQEMVENRLGGRRQVNTCVLMTGPICALAKSISHYMSQKVQTTYSSVTVYDPVPTSWETTSIQNGHDWFGCLCDGNTCRAESLSVDENEKNEEVIVPSWMSILRHQQGTYWDRQLPFVQLLHVMDKNDGNSNSDAVAHYYGDRRIKTTTPIIINKKKKRFWYGRLAIRERWEIVVVMGPSLNADSRPLQQEIMQNVLEWYRRLLPPNNNHSLCIRAESEESLQPYESSRLLLEGRIPGPKLQSSPIILAYISNLQDYCTGKEILRHGTTKEGLHVLQGVLCHVEETVEWLCQNHKLHDGVAVPPVLGQQQIIPERLLYCQNVLVGKNGKKIVRPILPHDDDDDDDDDNNNKTNTNPEPKRNHRPKQPLPERVRAEALSCPFGFLPFHYK